MFAMKKLFTPYVAFYTAHISQFQTKFAALLLLVGLMLFFGVAASNNANADGERREGTATLLTIHDRGVDQVIVTHATTVRAALEEADIELASQDAIEPSLDAKLVANEYQVNIYRARPVIVIDGDVRRKVMTAYQTPDQIAEQVGIVLYNEDAAVIGRSSDLVSDGASLTLKITRAVPFQFTLYGQTGEARTQGKTVGAMLKEKNIELTKHDRVVPAVETPLTQGMEVRVWREGKQTVTVEEDVVFEVEQIRDANRLIGYKQVQTPGVVGKRSVTYEIETRDGNEVKRVEIASVAKSEPTKQVEVVGIKNNGNGLTKSMGVKMFTDSNGVTHRETYYDLDMKVVMGYCGGGSYSVREDGAKIDSQGYILVAANLPRYPRCSIVETSLGLGKVYDTGGFAKVHPDGFDLATDWTNNNGI